jgi:KilA-N domain
MKTNVNMIRVIGDINVIQRTKDGYFNATLLLKSWRGKNGSKKELKEFFENKSTNEFISVLIEEENLHGGNPPYHKSKANKGKNMGTWMHPYLFIKFAMWINPKFEYHVIKFVHDNLIAFRKTAGDNYRSLTQSSSTLIGCDYPQIAKALNYIVFNNHYAGIRQAASEEELAELNKVQEKLCFAIDMGYIKTYDELIHSMRKMWEDKYLKF